MIHPPQLNLQRLLLVDDSPSDAELIVSWLRRAGVTSGVHIATTADEARRALDLPWDTIITDYTMPGYRAPDLLQWRRNLGLETPVVVVSHEYSETRAFELYELGAADYVAKSTLWRLLIALRQIEEKQCQACEQGRLYEKLSGNGCYGILAVDAEGRLDYANTVAAGMFGIQAELSKKPGLPAEANNLHDSIGTETTEPLNQALREKRPVSAIVREIASADGRSRWISVSASPIYSPEGKVVCAVANLREVKRIAQ